MRSRRGLDLHLQTFLILPLDGVEWLTSPPPPRPLYFGGGKPFTQWIGLWVGPTGCLEVVAKGLMYCPTENRTPVVQALA